VACLVPESVRDRAYDRVARVRYRVFGTREDTCPLLYVIALVEQQFFLHTGTHVDLDLIAYTFAKLGGTCTACSEAAWIWA
jgi:hypothetical protein